MRSFLYQRFSKVDFTAYPHSEKMRVAVLFTLYKKAFVSDEVVIRSVRASQLIAT